LEIGGKSVALGLSVGYARYPEDADNGSALLVAADLAVAEAKRRGRNRAVGYDPSLSHIHARRFDLCRALPLALERGELSLHYQPIFECKSGRLHGYEALMRWHHQQMGQIDPDEFIAIAEETDAIRVLGEWALREACLKARDLAERDFMPRMAVNVSVRQLLDPEFALRVAQILSETGLPAQLLELEVTESLFTTDRLESSRAVIESLHALGVTLSIDDFGTGYSSLSRLLSVPVSTVKIDRSFIAELDKSGSMVIESTIVLARKMGIAVLAEGVETRQQADRLTAMGVDLFQGYLFGRPTAMERQRPAKNLPLARAPKVAVRR
jgi:EAL domain-containing protein (putative c-di-GMP-specific phosphodiesterase class I)